MSTLERGIGIKSIPQKMCCVKSLNTDVLHTEFTTDPLFILFHLCYYFYRDLLFRLIQFLGILKLIYRLNNTCFSIVYNPFSIKYYICLMFMPLIYFSPILKVNLQAFSAMIARWAKRVCLVIVFLYWWYSTAQLFSY